MIADVREKRQGLGVIAVIPTSNRAYESRQLFLWKPGYQLTYKDSLLQILSPAGSSH